MQTGWNLAIREASVWSSQTCICNNLCFVKFEASWLIILDLLRNAHENKHRIFYKDDERLILILLHTDASQFVRYLLEYLVCFFHPIKLRHAIQNNKCKERQLGLFCTHSEFFQLSQLMWTLCEESSKMLMLSWSRMVSQTGIIVLLSATDIIHEIILKSIISS